MKHCPVCETAYPNHVTNCDADGELLVDYRELDPGTVIRNKYRIVKFLGVAAWAPCTWRTTCFWISSGL